jgi:hypothetical protein
MSIAPFVAIATTRIPQSHHTQGLGGFRPHCHGQRLVVDSLLTFKLQAAALRRSALRDGQA